VVQFRLVTPDGVYRTANAYINTDLFWALRGGGGSTFGVVLETTFTVESQMKLQVAYVSFSQTSTNTKDFFRLVVDNSLQWAQEGWGGHVHTNGFINVTPLLTLDKAKESLKPISDFVLSQGGSVVIEELPSWYAFFQKYVLFAETAVGVELILGTRLVPTSLFQTSEGRDQLYNTLISVLPSSSPGMLLTTPSSYNYTEGTTSVTPAWRKSLWHLGMSSGLWQFNSTVDFKRAQFERVSNATQTMRNITPGSGAYFNEGDVYEPNHEESFWGTNYPRLLSLKNTYDPLGLLDCWQCVGWKGVQDPRYSCYL